MLTYRCSFRRTGAAILALSVAALGVMTAHCGQASNRGNSADEGGLDARVARVPAQHRAVATACMVARPAGSPISSACVFDQPCPEEGGLSTCSSDSECDAGVNGRCNCSRLGFTINSSATCSYDTCASDDDCCDGGAGCKAVCRCRESAPQSCAEAPNVCVPSGCRVDSDCGEGGYCSPSPVGTNEVKWGASYAYFCHTANDQCIEDTDCPDAGNGRGCFYDGTASRWVCGILPGPDGS